MNNVFFFIHFTSFTCALCSSVKYSNKKYSMEYCVTYSTEYCKNLNVLEKKNFEKLLESKNIGEYWFTKPFPKKTTFFLKNYRIQ